MMAGKFLSMEGMDGAGKSTQIQLLSHWLAEQGHRVVLCRDPGGTAISEEIRQILLTTSAPVDMRTEMLLYMAARAQLVAEIIKPAIDRNEVVICDRFLLSTVVYQGHAGGLDPAMIWRVGAEGTGGLLPDWTGVLDLPPGESAKRRTGPADRIEQRSLEYYGKVRAGYLAEAERHPDRITLLNAMLSPDEVQNIIRREVLCALEK
jgi:dTMP kinase